MNPPTHRHSITISGAIITLTGAILFSTKAIIVKKAFAQTGIDAVSLLALRMLFSLPFYLAAAVIFSKRGRGHPLTRKQWVLTFLMGLFGYYISSLFDFIGLQYISAGLERLILFLYPTFAVLINLFFFRQPVHKAQGIALFLTYAGIGIAFLGEVQIMAGSSSFWWGSACVFICSITYAIYLVGSGRLIPNLGSNRFTAYAMLSAILGVGLHFVFSGGQPEVLINKAVVPYGLLLAVLATVAPTFLLAQGMKRIGSNNAAILSSIGPVSTILQAHYFLGEKILTSQVVGTSLVVAGILLLSWKPAKMELEM